MSCQIFMHQLTLHKQQLSCFPIYFYTRNITPYVFQTKIPHYIAQLCIVTDLEHIIWAGRRILNNNLDEPDLIHIIFFVFLGKIRHRTKMLGEPWPTLAHTKIHQWVCIFIISTHTAKFGQYNQIRTTHKHVRTKHQNENNTI